MSHTHVGAQTLRLLCELSLRCDGGTSESHNGPIEFRIRALREHPLTLLLTLAFDIATSSHRNSARHMEKCVVQRNEFVCSSVMSETFNQLIQKERVTIRLRNDLYCVEWGVKLYSLTHPCLTSQIFAVVDFAKHRADMRRLHLRHYGNIVQYSHGSIATPSTPQFEHVILARCGLGDMSEIIEQM